jgi:hypothetical protein
MLALMHISSVPTLEVRGGHNPAAALVSKTPSVWRRFLDALLMAMAAPAV